MYDNKWIMKIGDLVRFLDGELGIVTEVFSNGNYTVSWADGGNSKHHWTTSMVEAICK
tara:strand:- start:128 stop:301 length:174 start_codon:yes stop_codon:yes gene_type:complete